MPVLNQYSLRVILIGECGVGKTSILERYHRNYFTPESRTTIGIDFAVKHITLDDNQIKLQIWDTSGQEKFHSITKSYYRSGDICLLVYDTGSTESFDTLGGWFQEYRESNPTGILVVVGTKTDNPKVVQTEQLKQFADTCQALYAEVSSKTGAGVDPLFDLVIREAIQKKQTNLYPKPSADQIVHLQDRNVPFSQCSGCVTNCYHRKTTMTT
jgi:small GTP-binding protein